MSKKKILILGAEGMLGNTLFLSFLNDRNFQVKGTIKNKKNVFYQNKKIERILFKNVNVTKFNKIQKIINEYKPNYVINCIGITNKKIRGNSLNNVFKINSLLPKFLSMLSNSYNFKFIHISTDCVFDGTELSYTEKTFKSAVDDYGVSKSLGEEIEDNSNSLILRTSIIGHDLKKKDGLLEWFLSQKEIVKGYNKVIYSGLSTVELSKIIIKIVKNQNIYGLYQISSKRISKYKLLNIIKKIYNFKVKITKDKKNIKNLVLKSEKFKNKTKIKVGNWVYQINEMKKFYNKYQLPILNKFKYK